MPNFIALPKRWKSKIRLKPWWFTFSIRWVTIPFLDNPPVQNYCSKSETATIITGCWNFCRIHFFSRFSFRILGSWFFSPFRWVFSPFQNRQTHAKWQKCKKLFGGRKNAASNNSWRGNNFAYVGRRRYITSCFEITTWCPWFWTRRIHP